MLVFKQLFTFLKDAVPFDKPKNGTSDLRFKDSYRFIDIYGKTVKMIAVKGRKYYAQNAVKVVKAINRTVKKPLKAVKNHKSC
jgi:hypothetical protein